MNIFCIFIGTLPKNQAAPIEIVISDFLEFLERLLHFCIIKVPKSKEICDNHESLCPPPPRPKDKKLFLKYGLSWLLKTIY